MDGPQTALWLTMVTLPQRIIEKKLPCVKRTIPVNTNIKMAIILAAVKKICIRTAHFKLAQLTKVITPEDSMTMMKLVIFLSCHYLTTNWHLW